MKSRSSGLFSGTALAALCALSFGHGTALAAPTDDNTGSAAASADANSSADTGYADIVVTAQKRSEKALDVPVAMTIVSAANLLRGAGTTNLNLTFVTPGLKMDRNGVNTAPAIRGVSSLISGPGLDANVATYIDGVYISNPAGILDLTDISEIIVLKGPQGTLFGRNATGGAIQINTLKPSFDFSGNLSASYGRFDDVTLKGFVTGPIIADKLAASVSAYRETRDGILNDIRTGKRVGDLEAWMVRGKLLLTPTEDISLTLAGYYSVHKNPALQWGTPVRGITAAQGQVGAIIPSGPYNVATNRPAQMNQKGHGVSLTGEVDTAPGTLTVIAAYNYATTDNQTPAYGAFAPAGGFFYRVPNEPDKTYSVEANFASRDNGKFNYILGLYYYHNVGAYDPVKVISDAPAFVASIFGYQKSRSLAAFADGSYDITDQLTLTAGIRYSTERRSVTGQAGFGNFDEPPAPLALFGRKTFTAWTPRVSLRYAVTPTTNVYATYSQGFKSGGYDPSSVFGGVPPLEPVKPEKLKAWEIGLKTAPSRSFSLNTSAFYYKYSNQQVSAFVQRNGVALSRTINAASSTIYGADAEATALLTPEFKLTASFAWTHARFDSFPGAVVFEPNFRTVNGRVVPVGNLSLSANAKGNTLPRSPNLTGSIGAEYTKETSIGEIMLKADYFRSGHFFFDVGNRFRQNAYSNLDASASLTLPNTGVTLTAWGKNLTDAVVPAGSFLTATAALYWWGMPRTYGVTAALKF